MHPLCKWSFHGIKSMLDHFARIPLPCVPEGRYTHALKPTAAGPSASSDCFGVQQLLQIPSDNFCYVLIFWVNPTLLCWPKWFKYTHLGSSRQLVPLPPLGCCCLQCTALWEPKCHCLTATTLRGYSPSAAFRGWQPLELIKPSHRSSLSLLPCTLLALLHCSLSPAPCSLSSLQQKPAEWFCFPLLCTVRVRHFPWFHLCSEFSRMPAGHLENERGLDSKSHAK